MDAGNEGVNMLARILDERVKLHGDKPPLLDFGGIQDDMSLLTNRFPLPIPQSDYMVCRSVSWGAVDSIFYKTQYQGKEGSGSHGHGEHGQHGGHSGGDGSHSHPSGGAETEHVHDVLIGPKYRWLRPGDRVLVAWVGDDACVIDLILPATVIG